MGGGDGERKKGGKISGRGGMKGSKERKEG